MKDFKKGGKFGGGRGAGGFNKGGFDRGTSRGPGGFRGSQGGRDSSRPMEMHQAKCANCGKMCEVPFLPNGKKPVFCKECFAEQRGESQGDFSRREAPRSFQRRDDAPSYTPQRAPAYVPKPQVEDRRIDDLKNQLAVVNRKLDVLTETLEKFTHTVSEKAPKDTKALASIVKKVAKKTAPKKK